MNDILSMAAMQSNMAIPETWLPVWLPGNCLLHPWGDKRLLVSTDYSEPVITQYLMHMRRLLPAQLMIEYITEKRITKFNGSKQMDFWWGHVINVKRTEMNIFQ